MKNLLLFSLLLLISFQLIAQEKESTDLNFILGGSFNFSFGKNDNIFFINSSPFSNEFKTSSFRFAPFFGKEISQNWLVGINLLYGSRVSENEPEDLKSKITDISLGIMSRYYFTPLNKFSFFAQPFLAFTSGSNKNEQSGIDFDKRTTTSISGGVAAGARYRLTKVLYTTIRFGGLTYNNGKTTFDNSDIEIKSNSFGLDLRLSSIFFGVELSLN